MGCTVLIGCRAYVAIALLTISLGSNGASTITNLQNNQDLAPNFAGTLYGIANFIGGTAGFLAPMITGLVTRERVSVVWTERILQNLAKNEERNGVTRI